MPSHQTQRGCYAQSPDTERVLCPVIRHREGVMPSHQTQRGCYAQSSDTERVLCPVIRHREGVMPSHQTQRGCYAQSSDTERVFPNNQVLPNGGLDKHKIEPAKKPFWKTRGEWTKYENLLLYVKQIVVPTSLQGETLQKLHQGKVIRASNGVIWERDIQYGGRECQGG